MFSLRGAGLGLWIALLTVGLLQVAGAADLRLTDVSAQEDGKHVRLRFTFSEAVKPDVTYFYTHNYVGLRATGLQFSSAQLKRDVPAPSEDAARTYRYVRFVQDKESGEIRLYLTKPLTPADAQVVPYDTYTDVTLLKPVGTSKPMTPVTGEVTAPTEQPAVEAQPDQAGPASEVVSNPTPVDQDNAADGGETPPTLRTGSPEALVPSEPVVTQSETVEPLPADEEPASATVQPETAQPIQPTTEQRIGGPSYTDFDLDKVPVTQLVFKGTPFRDALSELVASTGYNVVISDDVDNSEVTLNFNQKALSLKSALDLLALAFDLTWSIEPDAIVIKAKPVQ